MSTKHDPRINPQPGDVVHDRKRNIVRHVITREGGNIKYKRERQQGPQFCWITTWQDWCRKNKVEVLDD